MELKRSMSQKLRMNGGDYSRPGWYFVTMGADYRRHYFGAIKGCEMHPNALGRLVETCWREIPRHYRNIELGAWQLMPNHFHGLVRIIWPTGKGLGEIMNVFKGAVTRQWRRSGGDLAAISRYSGKKAGGKPVPAKIWCPNYHDVICFEPEQLAIREAYIRANPKRWALRDVPQGMIRQSRYKGNATLLQQPGPRKALRLSRRTPEPKIAALQNELAAYDGIVCSTFFSPGERACLKTLQNGPARIVWILPMAMPERIPVSWTDAFLQGRALWLSAFPNELQQATRISCQQANRWVQQFCDL